MEQCLHKQGQVANHIIRLVSKDDPNDLDIFEGETIDELYDEFMNWSTFLFDTDAWQEALDDPDWPQKLKLTYDEFEVLFKNDVVAALQFYNDVTEECGEGAPEILSYWSSTGVDHIIV